MATLIAYWKGTTHRRSTKVATGLLACLVAIGWCLTHPAFGVRLLEWTLARRNARGESRSPHESESTIEKSDAETAVLSQSPPSQVGLDPRHQVTVSTPEAGKRSTAEKSTARSAPAGPSNSQDRVKPQSAVDEHSLLILRQHYAMLKSGRQRFAAIPAYGALLSRRERLGSELTDLTTLMIKVRHQPLSVYLKWQDGSDAGKELLYIDGENDGSMLVRLGGFKGRLIPAFKVDPNGALALSQARYPITKAGILGTTDSLIEHREEEFRKQVYAKARQEADSDCDGRRCAVFVFEFDDPQRSPDYRKSIQYLDRQWNVPLFVENYGWPEPGLHMEGTALDEATLIEYYKYSNVVAAGQVTDDDFSPSNPEYRFRR